MGGATFNFLTPTPEPGRPGGTLRIYDTIATTDTDTYVRTSSYTGWGGQCEVSPAVVSEARRDRGLDVSSRSTSFYFACRITCRFAACMTEAVAAIGGLARSGCEAERRRGGHHCCATADVGLFAQEAARPYDCSRRSLRPRVHHCPIQACADHKALSGRGPIFVLRSRCAPSNHKAPPGRDPIFVVFRSRCAPCLPDAAGS